MRKAGRLKVKENRSIRERATDQPPRSLGACGQAAFAGSYEKPSASSPRGGQQRESSLGGQIDGFVLLHL